MNDSWISSDPYEYFMGRWSHLVAQSFTDWISPAPGLKWLDVGCGTGALSKVVINRHEPAELTAIDLSESFVITAQKHMGSLARCRVGNALSLPLEDSSVDVTVSGLVLNFISEPEKALAEMKRVTVAGGIVALYVWDYVEKMDFLRHFWDVATELHPKASGLHEGNRFPDTNPDAIKALFKNAGFSQTLIAPIEIETRFRNFDDYWKPFLGGQGPAPSYLASLGETEKADLRDALLQRLPIQPDGSIPMSARAWAARGQL